MSELKVYSEDGQECGFATRDPGQIAARLLRVGAVFEHYELVSEAPDAEAQQDELIEGERELINSLMRRHAFATLDVFNLNSQAAGLDKLHHELGTEHWHPDHEARLFLSGEGCFYLRHEHEILAVHCRRGDFLLLPARVNHWCDLRSPQPVSVIRLYSSADSWQAIPSTCSQPPIAAGTAGRGIC